MSTRIKNSSRTVALGLITCAPFAVAYGNSDVLSPETAMPSAPAAQLETAGPVYSSQETGRLIGKITSLENGTPIFGAVVRLRGTDLAGTTDEEGRFRINSVRGGSYTFVISKEGFADTTRASVEILPNQSNTHDFSLASKALEPNDDVLMLDALEVSEGAPTTKMEAVSVRLDADKLVNVFSASDFTKFAAGDVAAALNRVSGVNVVEGQFAIIRGMEDRYSSTLYNNAPVPSPDPDSQSVQLDLFPSDIVSNLVVAKTFAGDLPGNSAGGSLNIITHDYPENTEIKVSGGTGFNENANKRFLSKQDGSPLGKESSTNDIINSSVGVSMGGRRTSERFGEREFRYKASFGRDIDFDTSLGTQEGREPRSSNLPRPGRPVRPENRSGDLAFGRLGLSDGRFDYTDSTRTEQTSAYLGFGFDVDEAKNHKIDFSIFYTAKDEERVQLKENGFIPGYDYVGNAPAPGDDFSSASFDNTATLGTWVRDARANPSDGVNRGHLHFTNLNETVAYQKERDLFVAQINGDHQITAVDGLKLRWAANQASTSQEEDAFGIRYFYEPNDKNQVPATYPARAEDLGPGVWAVNKGITLSSNTIDESQHFGRIDTDYDLQITDRTKLLFTGGASIEKATRDVDSSFLENPTVGATSEIGITAPTRDELGQSILPALDRTPTGVISGLRMSTNESERDIQAAHLGAKLTLLRNLDLLGSFRFEDIFIKSNNDAFTGEQLLGAPQIFPSRYLMFDRFDNPSRGEVTTPPPAGTSFNDQLLGIDVPVNPTTGIVDLTSREQIESLINGQIDEQQWLPSVGLAYRVNSRLTLRAAYSQTVARPSFRELGYYVSVDPGSSDLTIGNPQLDLSEVDNWDARAEYTWGDKGDLVAFSVFSKDIDNAIESIVIRDPGNAEGGGLYRTFFNNPSQAKVRGIEFEARKDLGFIGGDLPEYFSLGGNITYIDAEVDRTPLEIARAQSYFNTLPGQNGAYTQLATSRRLYNQPEWIANIDLTFDQPDWGTTATLAVFAISDVLDAAGSASFAPNGQVISYTLDRYTSEFYQMDFVVSQKWRDWTFRLSVKNLTDTTRKTVYDPEQLSGEVAERAFKVGRDYSLSASYSF